MTLANILMLSAALAAGGTARPERGVRAYPESAFLHAGRGGHLIDVTKAPFFARGDGIHDDTAALKSAMKFAKDNIRVAHAQDGSVVGSPRRDSNWTVYLPRGTYLISDTVSYGWPTTAMALHYGWRDLRYVRIESEASEARIRELDRTRPKGAPVSFGAEVNWNVRVIGESREGTVIRLKDGAAGFGAGADKPMISYHLTRRGSNVNYGNVLENLTIDAGRGNPGAVGVKWASSNCGVIRDVTFRADGASIGVNMPISNACGYMHDLDVSGFRKGFRMRAGAESTMTVERTRVSGADVGFSLEGCDGGADLLNLRKIGLADVKTDIAVLGKGARVTVRDCGFRPDTRPALVPAEDPPEMQWPALADIATPEEFGAVGDGLHDDTAAIQRAFRSGRRAVYFTRAAYAIEGTVEIPEAVTLADGMYAGFVRHRTGTEAAMFRLAGGAAAPFEIRRLYMVGAKLLDHVSPRVAYVGDVFVEFPQGREVTTMDDCVFPGHFERSDVQWYAYRNADPSVRKRVFAENCVGLFAQAEPNTTNYLENVDLYARAVNNERGRGGTSAYAMRNCRAWIYGAKSELCRISIDAIDSEVDVSGFNYLNWDPSDFPEAPVIRMRRSEYAIDGFFWKTKSSQPIVLREIGADGRERDRLMGEFPERPGENGFEVRLDSRADGNDAREKGK